MNKIYLDTSVPSAVFDLGKPERLQFTDNWFNRISGKFEFFTSELTINEINELITVEKRENIKGLISERAFKILKISDEAQKLSEIYISKGAIPVTEPEDALHIAIAVINHIPNLASWDFKHIVSKNPVRKISELNEKLGYPIIKIGSPGLFTF